MQQPYVLLIALLILHRGEVSYLVQLRIVVPMQCHSYYYPPSSATSESSNYNEGERFSDKGGWVGIFKVPPVNLTPTLHKLLSH